MLDRGNRFSRISILAFAVLLVAGGLWPPAPFGPEASAASVWSTSGLDGFNGTGCEFNNTTLAQGPGNASIVLNVTGDWFQQMPLQSPPALDGAAMAAIGNAGKVLLFGGQSGNNMMDDTWLFDPADGTWTQLSPKDSPPASQLSAMASVGNDDKAVLYGGVGSGGGPYCDTWVFDLSDNEWYRQDPATHPPFLYGHSMASFANDSRVLLFGGEKQDTSFSSESWLFDAGTGQWNLIYSIEGPPERTYSAMAGIWNDDRAVLFGGTGPGWMPLDDTWVFDLAQLKWQQMSPATGPEARDSHSMAAVPGESKILLFGGYQSASFNSGPSDTWAYDAIKDSWTVLGPSEEPQRRYMAGLAPLTNGSVLLFGGARSGSYSGLSDTWVYDDAALAARGSYRSPYLDNGESENLLTLRWNGSLPPGSRVEFQIRTAFSPEQLRMTPFTGPDGTGQTFYAARYTRFEDVPVERWFQYRMFLSSGDRIHSPAVQSVEVRFDRSPRAPIPVSPGMGAWTNDTLPVFEWTFQDDDSASQRSFELQLGPTDGFGMGTFTTGEVESAQTSFTPQNALTDGEWFWRVRTRDPEGMWGPFSVTARFGVDTEPPAEVLVEADPAGWGPGPFSLNFTSSDNPSGLAGYDLWLDGIGLGRAESPYAVPPLDNGVHTAVVQATDLAGNRASGSCRLYVDRDPPDPFTPVADPPSWTNGPIQVAYSTSDSGSGVFSYDVRVDGGDFTRRPSPYVLTDLADGVHNVTVRASDRTGHYRDASVSVYSDRTAPFGLEAAAGTAGWTNATPTLIFSADDAMSGIDRYELGVNGGNFSPAVAPCVPGALVEGNNTVTVRAYDKAGNHADARLHVLLDRTAPDLFQPVAGPPGWTNRTPVVKFSTADNGSGIDHYEVIVDGKAPAAAASPLSLANLSDGEHGVTIRAFDRAGNSADGTVEVLFDATAPSGARLRVNGGAGTTGSGNVSLEVSATDGASGVALMCFSNDGRSYSEWEPFRTNRSWQLSSGEGQKRVYVKVMDAAGNVARPASATIQLEGKTTSLPVAVGISAVVLLMVTLVGWRALQRARRGR